MDETNQKLISVIIDALKLNSEIMVKNLYLTVIILTKNLTLKEKELLLIIYKFSLGLDEYLTQDIPKGIAHITLNDFEKLGTHRKNASKSLNSMATKGVISWDRVAHSLQIHKSWIEKELLNIPKSKIEAYHSVLLKQIYRR